MQKVLYWIFNVDIYIHSLSNGQNVSHVQKSSTDRVPAEFQSHLTILQVVVNEDHPMYGLQDDYQLPENFK